MLAYTRRICIHQYWLFCYQYYMYLSDAPSILTKIKQYNICPAPTTLLQFCNATDKRTQLIFWQLNICFQSADLKKIKRMACFVRNLKQNVLHVNPIHKAYNNPKLSEKESFENMNFVWWWTVNDLNGRYFSRFELNSNPGVVLVTVFVQIDNNRPLPSKHEVSQSWTEQDCNCEVSVVRHEDQHKCITDGDLYQMEQALYCMSTTPYHSTSAKTK